MTRSRSRFLLHGTTLSIRSILFSLLFSHEIHGLLNHHFSTQYFFQDAQNLRVNSLKWIYGVAKLQQGHSMKTLFIVTGLLFTTLSFAGTRILCQATDSVTKKVQRVTLTQVGDTKMYEQARYDFVLEVSKPGSRAIQVKEIVALSFEDVMVKANNRAKKLQVMIFMDEPIDSWMTIGTQHLDLVCGEINL